MNYYDGNSYVEVKDKRQGSHSTAYIILGLRDEPIALRSQYRVQKDTQIRQNQKNNKNEKVELVVKNYPKQTQPNI